MTSKTTSTTHHLRITGAVLGAALALAAWPTDAQAQNNTRFLSDVSNAVPPLVMVLLDTSGSMEFERSTGSVPVCTRSTLVGQNIQPVSCTSDAQCGYDIDGNGTINEALTGRVACDRGKCVPTACVGNNTCNFAKPRGIIAKEVFTGTFKGYECRQLPRGGGPSFDNDYPIPHFKPVFSRRVRETGLIFLNRDLVRFGFMAFDSLPSSGDTFSFPNPVQAPETNIWNLGARGPNAENSPLIDFGDLNDPRVGLQRAESVENAILNFIPFGSTPLAALFRDLNTFFATDTDVVNDLFAQCRGRDVVVVTDGQPSFDQCAPGEDGRTRTECAGYPYRTTLQELAELKVRHGVNVHVIGFDLDPADKQPCRGATGFDNVPNNVECVHQLAMVGGTDSNGDPNDNVAAYIATDQVTLTRELTKIINKIVDGTTARTKVATTRRTAFRTTNAGTYQFSSAFDLDPDFHLWRGRLERIESRCSNGQLTVSDALNFGDDLNTRTPSTRRIFTALLNRDLNSRPIDEAFITENSNRTIRLNRQLSTLRTLINDTNRDATFEAGVFSGSQFSDILGLLDGSSPDRRPARQADRRVLGDIFHSNPTIVGGPELSLNIPGYQRFANAVNPLDDPRTTTVYVGSNDGMLHAFDAESDTGSELWAFLPLELQNKIYLQKATHIFGVDGTPKIADVRMFRGQNLPEGIFDPVNDNGQSRDPSNFHDIWDSIAITGLRGGGRAYFALGVADPTNPRFIWELNPTVERRKLTHESDEIPAVDRLPNEPVIGQAFGDVAMGTVVLTDENGDKVERGVAIIPGGVPPNVSSPGNIGRAVFVVDLNNGDILRRFTTYNNDTNFPFSAAVTGSVAAHNDFPGKVLTRAFVGDAAGRLLRVDLRSSNPAEWTVKIFHDAFDGLQPNDTRRQPIFLRPSIALNRAGEMVVLYGTGDIDDIENRKGGNLLFSVTERLVFNDGEFTIDSFDAIENFQVSFTGAEKLTGAPLIFGSVAYFPTFVPNNTPCSRGNGRVYAIDFNQTFEGNIIGRFDSNDEQFDQNNNNGPQLVLNSGRTFFDLGPGSVVFGLEIAQKPTCTPDVPEEFDNDIGNPGDVSNNVNQDIELIAQVGNNSDVGQLGPQSQINTLKFKLNRPPSAIFPLSWSSILD